jgi:hypothetical protein
MSDSIAEAAESIWEMLKAIFITTPAMFVNQQVHNRKASEMSAAERKAQLEASAANTVGALAKEPTASVKTIEHSVQSNVEKSSKNLQQQLNKANSTIETLKCKQEKLEKMLARRDKKQKKSSPAESDISAEETETSAKGRGGQAKGAQTNPSSKNSRQQPNQAHQNNAREGSNSHPTQNPKSILRTSTHSRGGAQKSSDPTETESPNPTHEADDVTNDSSNEKPVAQKPNDKQRSWRKRDRRLPKSPRGCRGQAEIWLPARSLTTSF